MKPVAKDGKQGKGKSSGLPGDITKKLLDAVFPSEKNTLTLTPKKEKGQKGDQQPKKDGSNMVGTYANSISEHMLRHYEMFATTASGGQSGSPLNLMDLIYYHTLGDYRMTYVAKNNKISFQYTTLSKGDIGAKKHAKSEKIEELLNRAEVPGINYVYTKKGTTITYEIGQVSWMDQELNKGSNGLRLMLPSIGTLMMQTYGYGNINIPLQKLLTSIAVKLNDVLQDIQEGNNLLDYLESAILSDDRYQALGKSVVEGDPDNPDQMKVAQVISEARDKYDKDDNWADAIKHAMDELIESTTSRYVVGEEVKIKPKAGLAAEDQNELAELVEDYNDFEEEVYTIDSVNKNPDKSYNYNIQHTNGVVSFALKQSQLSPSGSPTSRIVEKQKKAFVRIPDPRTIVFYSIIVDQLFALQAYLFTIKASDSLTFGYLSPNMMPDKKSDTAAKLFPEMYTPNSIGKPPKESYLKKGLKGNKSLLGELAVHRNLYTQLILKTQRSLAQDSRNFDEFYKEDLTLTEETIATVGQAIQYIEQAS